VRHSPAPKRDQAFWGVTARSKWGNVCNVEGDREGSGQLISPCAARGGLDFHQGSCRARANKNLMEGGDGISERLREDSARGN